MKTNAKLFGTLILMTLTSILHLDAAQINGIWMSQDRSIWVEIEKYDRGIRVRHGNQSWRDYYRKGNRFESRSGSFCRIIDDHSLEWYDRNSRRRHILYRENQYGWNWNDSRNGNRYSDRFGRNQLRDLEGNWYNESTGQRIQIKTKRDRIRVKFQGEGWIDFVQGRNGRFIDEYGNKWTLNRDYITFESFNRDLIMQFHKGDYLGKRHRNYFRFRS